MYNYEILSETLTNDQEITYEINGDQSIKGLSRYVINVIELTNAELTLSEYSENFETWFDLGYNTINTVGKTIIDNPIPSIHKLTCTQTSDGGVIKVEIGRLV